jgi:hypothetical protein
MLKSAANKAGAKKPDENCRRLEVEFMAPFFYRNSQSLSSSKKLESIMASMARR